MLRHQLHKWRLPLTLEHVHFYQLLLLLALPINHALVYLPRSHHKLVLIKLRRFKILRRPPVVQFASLNSVYVAPPQQHLQLMPLLINGVVGPPILNPRLTVLHEPLDGIVVDDGRLVLALGPKLRRRNVIH